MKSFQVRLPDSVYAYLKKLAEREGISLNQALVTAASNEIVRQETREFFQGKSAAYDPHAFASALAVVPDVPPLPEDER